MKKNNTSLHLVDVLGFAIMDHHQGNSSQINIYINEKIDDPMFADVFFRNKQQLNLIEKEALKRAQGNILDIGAGAGCHSLLLQERFHVDAVEISKLSCQVMKERGVKNILEQDVFTIKNKKYDCILLLMNGLGLGGSIDNTVRLFNHLKTLLNPDGIILGDSSDIRYMFENPDDIQSYIENNKYYGEVTFELEYKNMKSNPFPWLFIDPEKMQEIALETGFEMDVLLENEQYQYLAQFSLKK